MTSARWPSWVLARQSSEWRSILARWIRKQSSRNSLNERREERDERNFHPRGATGRRWKERQQNGKPFSRSYAQRLCPLLRTDFDVQARSDLTHHLVEDVALALGHAFREIIPSGAARY